MLEKIRQTIEGKKVLILGFGREGRSSLRLVCKAGGWERLAVSDQREVDPSREAGENEVELHTGEHYMDRELLDSFDIVFKTPDSGTRSWGSPGQRERAPHPPFCTIS